MTDLARELATYKRALEGLLAHEGKYALVVGESVIGIYDAYGDALQAGYQAAGLEPFLVRKISGVETVSYFSRPIVAACQA